MNNIITNSTNAIGSGYGSGIRATSGGAPIISYNNVWNNLGGNYAVYISGSCSPGEADISQNPFFMNRAISDYSLSNLSPCIRAASPIGCPSYDIEGKLRGNPPDIGAFENIADGDQTLPVQLTSFTAEYKDNLIHIKWVTESELNNIGYEIYFKEISDTQYYFLAGYKTNESLKGHGTSSTANSYSYFHNSFKQNTIYYYKLRQVDLDGQMQEYGPVQVETTFSNNTSIPEEFYLSQNYPNPFNPSTTIEFSLQAPEQVSLKVYSILGHELAELIHDTLPAGAHKTVWNAKDCANGIYYIVLEANGCREVRKAVLMK